MDDDTTSVEPEHAMSLSERLHETAERFEPATDAALDSVLAAAPRTQTGRRHRAGVTITAVAASVVLLTGAAIVFSNNDGSPQLVDVDPAAGSGSSAPSVGTERVAQNDEGNRATLTMYTYPNAAPGQPRLMAMLHTSARTYFSGELPDGTTPDQVRFGPDAAWEYGYGDSWAIIDGVDTAQPDAAIQAIVDQRVGGPPNLLPAQGGQDTNTDSEAVGHLMNLISTGAGDANQVKTLVVLLQSIGGVQLSDVDGLAVIRTPGNGTLTYAPDTGKPVRWEWDGAPEATMEFIASYQVDSSTLLDPRAAQRALPPQLPTSTTTTIPGEPILNETTTTATGALTPTTVRSPTGAGS